MSILIPAFNAERWIGETLESALGQTWQRKEVIVVDDGSIDNTFKIAKNYEKANTNLTVFSQRSKGAGAARNRALEEAQGAYIQWLDADDLLAKDKIENQLAIAKENGRSDILLSAPFSTFYCNPYVAKLQPNPLWRDMQPVDYYLIKFTENAWLPIHSWLVSRELTIKAGIWDERLTLNDDGEYFSRVVASSKGIQFVKNSRCFYRVWNPGSLSRARNNEAARKSLWLSIVLCVQHLKEVEDSQQTREACLSFLQTKLYNFYPESPELVAKMRKLAERSGGQLGEPLLTWKYKVIKELFGWSAAKTARRIILDCKLLTGFYLDRMRSL